MFLVPKFIEPIQQIGFSVFNTSRSCCKAFKKVIRWIQRLKFILTIGQSTSPLGCKRNNLFIRKIIGFKKC